MNTLNQVTVVEVKATSDPETFQVQLQQILDKEVSTQAGLLGFTMEGHEKFTSSKSKRVAFQNFSKTKIEQYGIIPGKVLTTIPGIEKAKLVVVETLTPRTWYDKNTGELKSQNPKTAGKDGEVLTYDGQPIYRNIVLAINNMDFNDKLIAHNNEIVGSSVAVAQEAGTEASVGAPAIVE